MALMHYLLKLLGDQAQKLGIHLGLAKGIPKKDFDSFFECRKQAIFL